MRSRLWDVVSSSLTQFLYFTASAGTNYQLLSNNFSSPTALFCLPEGIYSPLSAVLYNVNDINGKTDKHFMPQEY